MQWDMGEFEDRLDLLRELLAQSSTCVPHAGVAQIVMFAAYRAAMRANRAFRPQNAFEMSECCDFIKKVRSRRCGNGTTCDRLLCGIELSTPAVVCQLHDRQTSWSCAVVSVRS